ncbi:MAG: methyltransferase domain-containing protein [Planctomycetes bacterium]|nr:methyltransferase domain-containing protein [Planctomycetota bacterium]
MSTPPAELLRYDLFGWDYAAINPLDPREIDWHLGWAARTGGPVLGLACGSARLLLRLAEAGHEVVGIDLSKTMLGIAAKHVERLPAVVRRRVTLLRRDMARFDLGRQFPLVLIPDNSFRELPTRRQLLQCLRTVRRHLSPEGRLLIVERRFRAEMYPSRERRLGWSQARLDPLTGESVRRRGRVRLRKDHRRLSGLFEYELTDLKGRARTVRCPWSAPVLDLDEYMGLFRRAGLKAEVFQDYGAPPGNHDAGLWCFVCSHE